MTWNRARDLTPIPHFLSGQNLPAARARLAELRFREKEAFITPPEKLPSWQWFNPRRGSAVRAVTNTDPAYARSALGGWEQRGMIMEDDKDFQSKRAEPSKPQLRNGAMIPVVSNEFKLSPAASAVERLRGCKFPIGDPRSSSFHFCNARRGVGCPYCARHAALCTAERGKR